MKIQESAQNYLEAILVINKEKNEVRAVDICSHLGFSRPTVSEMLKALRESGLVTVDQDNSIFLTDEGVSIAEKMYERHRVIADFFIKIGVSPKVAYADACRVEHYISDETFDRMKEHICAL